MIINLLREKHKHDLFITECKNGRTYDSDNLLMLDAYIMKRSWKNPLYIGYEIKTNRNDYTHDQKWQGYLKYTNEFYFVCPQNLINVSEVSDLCGLYWLNSKKTGLYLKKKAPYRKVEDLDLLDIFRYILICRSQIQKESIEQDKLKYWEDWLEKKEMSKDIGVRVSRGVRDIVDKYIHENNELKKKIDEYAEIKKFLADNHFYGKYDAIKWLEGFYKFHKRLQNERNIFCELKMLQEELSKMNLTETFKHFNIDNPFKNIDYEI